MTHLLAPIAWTLIHFCWQAAAIAAVFGIVNLLLTRASSQTRYLIALAALISLLVAAASTLVWQVRSELARTSAHELLPGPAGPLHNEYHQAVAPALPEILTQTSNFGQSAPALLPWIDGFWLLGVFVLSLRTLGGWWMLRRLTRTAITAVPAGVRASFDSLAATFNLRRPVALAISRSVSGPVTIGFLRATVLLPLSAITSLGPEELQVVFAHELAHVRRADFFWNLVQTFAETVFFFHPAVWWIGGCLRTERELCCDDLALRLYPNPVVYASALFHLEEQRSRHSHLVMALDGNRSGSTLRMRILRILGEPVTHLGRGPSRAFSATVALAGLLLLVLPTAQVLASLRPVHAAASPVQATKETGPVPAAPSVVDPAPSVAEPATPAPAPVPSPAPAFIAQQSAPPAEKPHPGTEAKSTYIDRMKAAGYDVDLDKYIAMKIQGVTPEYARQMEQAFGKLSADDLIACKVQGVNPETIQEMKRQGLEVSNVHDAISFRIFQVTPEFITGMKSAGFANLSSHQLITLRVQGVTPEYARSIVQEFPGATVDDIVKTKIFNINADFIASAKSHGFTNLKLEKLVQLRISGILDDEK